MQIVQNLVLLLLLGSKLVAAQDKVLTPCDFDQHTSGLPPCSNQCLVDRWYDATCGDNLRGHCSLSDGARAFFGYFGECLEQNCTKDDERYVFVEKFQGECAEFDKTITTIEGAFGRYLSRPPSTSSRITSTSTISSTSTKTITPSLTPITSVLSILSTPSEPSSSPIPPPASTPTPALPTNIPKPNSDPPNPTLPPPPPGSTRPSALSPTAKSSTSFVSSVGGGPAREEKPEFGTTQIAGTVAGGTVGLVLAVSVIAFILHRRRKRQQTIAHDMNGFPSHSSHFDVPKNRCDPPPVNSFHTIPPPQTSNRNLPWDEQKYNTTPPQGVPHKYSKPDINGPPIRQRPHISPTPTGFSGHGSGNGQPPVNFSRTSTGFSEVSGQNVQQPMNLSPTPTWFSELSGANSHGQLAAHTSRTPTGFSELSAASTATPVVVSRSPTGFSELSAVEARPMSPISPMSTGVSELSASGAPVRGQSSSLLPTVNELGGSEQRTLWKKNEDIGRNF
ncbi:hypothetical protein CC80DRAFT_541737 [Byssothecium circinans]|uniref:Uncharacterized protein n=1 Tax=Byssothecium circinans TaxID=147558 RepID=A0A6A5UFY1_9PLEO|nr:hypothetical protein CC80DRAFT_541737 [Byssothecium circinans]